MLRIPAIYAYERIWPFRVWNERHSYFNTQIKTKYFDGREFIKAQKADRLWNYFKTELSTISSGIFVRGLQPKWIVAPRRKRKTVQEQKDVDGRWAARNLILNQVVGPIGRAIFPVCTNETFVTSRAFSEAHLQLDETNVERREEQVVNKTRLPQKAADSLVCD